MSVERLERKVRQLELEVRELISQVSDIRLLFAAEDDQ